MRTISDLKVKIFADGADKQGMLEMYAKPFIKGFTTNPTLMKKAGVMNYAIFARDILKHIPDRSISFEVFSDDRIEMEREAFEIASWGLNVYVKIPVTNTYGEPNVNLVKSLITQGVKVNVTAITTIGQVYLLAQELPPTAVCYLSIFAGRIADTGRDPIPYIEAALDIVSDFPSVEIIWASPRELLNIFQADAIGCDIITVTNDILKKLDLVGKNLVEYSLETVQMFYNDAKNIGFRI